MFLATLSKPLDELAPQRPDTSIISAKMFFNIIGQFGVHLFCMAKIVAMAKELEPVEEFDPDAEDASEFKPTLVNSAVFLIAISMQASTIFTNYHGKPFMGGLGDNKGLVRCLLVLWGITILATLQFSTGFNEFLELVPFSSEFGNAMGMIIVADAAGAYAVDFITHIIFPLETSLAMKALRA
jgi:manganese-transporting P-type ATPase